MKKNICSIIAHKKHVNFQIMQGAHLKDAQELEGTGKDMRHININMTPNQNINMKIAQIQGESITTCCTNW
ncbi:MAG: hypothetical protein ABW100_10290, partial [Candidatus Thiodiazotropha sp. 6PLUC3]